MHCTKRFSFHSLPFLTCSIPNQGQDRPRLTSQTNWRHQCLASLFTRYIGVSQERVTQVLNRLKDSAIDSDNTALKSTNPAAGFGSVFRHHRESVELTGQRISTVVPCCATL